MQKKFDIVVIGGGHAGVEAAHAAARMGVNTLLITHNLKTIGELSCNPSIGGIGKGHLAKEIDALGGVMAKAADRAGIQFRILNASKGPAVRATRVQVDRELYKRAINELLQEQLNLTISQHAIGGLIIKNKQVQGVITEDGENFLAKAVVLTAGTFLNGRIHIGLESFGGGRAGDSASKQLANFLKGLGLITNRLKTGTPARIASDTIDYSDLIVQHSDDPQPVFSFLGSVDEHPAQRPCFITYTNEKTHEIIRNNLDRSPLFTGIIAGEGPRYCPSIEDKIHRFASRGSHQIFLEPEGLDSNVVYPNGISTSLPYDVQKELISTIEGLENSKILSPGYAIEYDFFDPKELQLSLATKTIENLYFAGQINGTTGYEEAGAQGLLAGINAVLKIQGKEFWCPRRDEAYIGVMIDDLLTRGTMEPYRMFTSRAEYRLMLREDNADLRLTEVGYQLGCVDEKRYRIFSQKVAAIEKEKGRLKNIFIRPNTDQAQAIEFFTGKSYDRENRVLDLLRRADVSYRQLIEYGCMEDVEVLGDVASQIEIQMKYHGYIERQQLEVERQRHAEEVRIPENFNYKLVKGLSNEVLQKLEYHQPATIGQASRISGVTPAAVSILLVYLKAKYR